MIRTEFLANSATQIRSRMSLLNPALLYGLGLIAVPVVLHFLLRAQPKKMLFPALRLIETRRRNNVRRMRLRHIWLLLLRIAVIALIVLAIARPSLPAANYDLSMREGLTLAAVVAVAFGIYWAVMRRWRSQRLPSHVFTYRRTLLRGGTAAVAIALLLLLVAWPYQRRVLADLAAPQSNVAENLPVAGVFLFDTSPSMAYLLESRTRLDAAREIATAHLNEFPPGSRIAAVGSAVDSPILFQADAPAAQARIDALEVGPVSFPISDRLEDAIRMQEEDVRRTLGAQESVAVEQRRDQYLRAVYIFTDMAKNAWRLAGNDALRAELERLPWLQVFIVDVGVDEPRNIALSDLRIARQTLPVGGDLVVHATVSRTAREADATTQTVELFVQNDNGDLVEKGQTEVALEGDAGRDVTFTVQGLTRPVTHGEVRLTSSDPLAADNARHFTVAVRPPPEVLVVGGRRDEAKFWYEALALTELARQGKVRYQATYWPAARLAGDDLAERLKKYDAVTLVNVRDPSDEAWRVLGEYVHSGGGLMVILGGSGIRPERYTAADAQQFLPASPAAFLRFVPPEFLDLKELAHPLLKRFEVLGGPGELTLMEVRRFWKVEPAEDATVVATYTDARTLPAIVERPYGEGRTVMLTTGVDRKGWSDLPLAGWSFLAFADFTMQYLGGRSESRYNYTAGDDVFLSLDRGVEMSRYLLRKPGLEQLPGEVAPDEDLLIIRDADQVGPYEVVGIDAEPPFQTGFSVNPPDEESDFTRLTPADLDDLLGEERYSIAKSIGDLNLEVQLGRIGKEMFPYVLLFVVMAFLGEHIVANRFYEADHSTEK